MQALMPTEFSCEIVYLGLVENRERALASAPRERVELAFGGIPGEWHGGLTRPSFSRVLRQHPRGTEIANTRQLSIVSAEEMEAVAEEIGIEAVQPEWMGASMMVRGLPDLTHIPPSSRLQGPSGATLVIDMENRPCVLPGREAVDLHHPGKGRLLKTAAEGRRGVTAWVERPGALALGDVLVLHVPAQRPWAAGGW